MKIPILNGIYTDQSGDYRTSYPRNLVPVAKETGINTGYLRPAPGIVHACDAVGADRGGINWNGEHYRVSGRKLIQISSSNVVTEIGTIAGGNWCAFDYSFDQLAIAGGGNLYYYDGTSLTRVTDVDLGTVLDMIWVDGYFMTTDGEYLVVTELNDPTSVNPLKYGSSEIDPDPVKRLLKPRGEVAALNRYTTEFFRNVGGNYFPFQRIEGAHVTKGCVGARSACLLDDNVVMVGGGRNEEISVWVVAAGSAQKIGTSEIDMQLNALTEADQQGIICETRVEDGHFFLYVHLPDKTLVYDAAVSRAMGEPVWFVLTSSIYEQGKYRARGHVYVHGRWYVGDPLSQSIGTLDNSISSHYGEPVSWDFSTQILYNDGRGAIFYGLELQGLPGRCALNADSSVWTDYSLDGMTWSQKKYTTAGTIGARNQRVKWLRNGSMRAQRIQRFGGLSDAHFTIARLEAELEPLYA